MPVRGFDVRFTIPGPYGPRGGRESRWENVKAESQEDAKRRIKIRYPQAEIEAVSADSQMSESSYPKRGSTISGEDHRLDACAAAVDNLRRRADALERQDATTRTDPPVSEAQRRAMRAAAGGNSTLGIPKSVGKEFSEVDPGGKLPETK